jgi:hypothetical protein
MPPTQNITVRRRNKTECEYKPKDFNCRVQHPAGAVKVERGATYPILERLDGGRDPTPVVCLLLECPNRNQHVESNSKIVSVSVLEDIFENVQIGPRASAVALVRTVQQKERGILAIGDQGL